MAKAKPTETPAVEISEPEIPVNKSSRNKKAIEKHTVTTEWKEVKRIDAPPSKTRKAAPIVEVEDDDDDAEDVDVELPDDVRAVLSEYDSTSGLVMEINRLPNYHLNGKQDPASMQFCGDRDFDPQEYKNILRLYYAKEGVPNFFILKLKTADRQWIPGGRIGPINVEAATPEEKARHGIFVPVAEPASAVTVTHAMPMPSMQTAQPPQSVTERIEEVARIFGIFKEMGLVQKQNPAPVQPAAPIELSEEAILLKAAMASPEVKDKVANGIGRLVTGLDVGGSKSSGVTEMIVSGAIDLAQSLMPTVGPALANFFNARAQAEQMRAYQLQQQLNGLPAAPSLPEQAQAVPQQMPEPQVPLEPLPIQAPVEMPPEDELFGRILGACARRQLLKPEVAARNLLDYTDQFTDQTTGYNKFNEAYDIFITNDVKTIIVLAAAQNPIAKRMSEEPDTEGWLKALQDELRKEWESGEQETGS